MDVNRASSASRCVLLSAARIAACVAEGRVPPSRELFVLAAAVAEAARQGDSDALQMGVESSAALLDGLPSDGAWQGCRGHVNATMQFAWLLLRMHGGNDRLSRPVEN
jgi:hypothetical protein